MKTNTLVFALGLFALGATVCPSAGYAASPAPKVIAEMYLSGGLIPVTYDLKVFDDGRVVVEETSFDGSPTTTIQLAHLAQPRADKIAAFGVGLTDVQLLDETPNDPLCLDAGEAYLYVLNEKGQRVVIAKTSGCHQFVRVDSKGYEAKATLQALYSLYSYTR